MIDDVVEDTVGVPSGEIICDVVEDRSSLWGDNMYLSGLISPCTGDWRE